MQYVWPAPKPEVKGPAWSAGLETDPPKEQCRKTQYLPDGVWKARLPRSRNRKVNPFPLDFFASGPIGGEEVLNQTSASYS